MSSLSSRFLRRLAVARHGNLHLHAHVRDPSRPGQGPVLSSSLSTSTSTSTSTSSSSGLNTSQPKSHKKSSTSTPSTPKLSFPSQSPPPPPPPKPSKPKSKANPAASRWNYNTSFSWDSSDPDPAHATYRRVTARDLRRRTEAPVKVKMLVRDFIDDSLYNPNYGYFSKQAQIFTPSSSSSSSSSSPTPSRGFDITSFPNMTAFQENVADQYERDYSEIAIKETARKGKFRAVTPDLQGDETVESGNGGKAVGGLGRQVWHTPTELFKPHYARSLTLALLNHYKLHHYPYTDFNLYEIGAGNGSMMVDVMRFLRESHPEVYDRTRYTIVEISEQLAARQKRRVREEGFEGKVKVENVDFFDWKGGNQESCYFIALEVFDNFAHDMVRYNLQTLEPLQALVSIDGSGDFSLIYEPVTDPLIRRYLDYRRLVNNPIPPAINPVLLSSDTLRRLYTSLPFAPNLSEPDFVPTKQMLFLEKLKDQLPNHRLLISDFDSLPETVEGRMGPVVQTRYGDSMVPCETFLVKQGYFDIFFPTDFEVLKEMYTFIMTSKTRTSSNGKGESGSSSDDDVVDVDVECPAGGLSKEFFDSAVPAQLQRRKDGAVGNAGAPPDLVGVRGFKQKGIEVYTHADFLTKFGGEEELAGTTTKDGGNVMLNMYKNAKFMF